MLFISYPEFYLSEFIKKKGNSRPVPVVLFPDHTYYNALLLAS